MDDDILKAIGFLIAGFLIIMYGISIIDNIPLAGAIVLLIGFGALIGGLISIKNSV